VNGFTVLATVTGYVSGSRGHVADLAFLDRGRLFGLSDRVTVTRSKEEHTMAVLFVHRLPRAIEGPRAWCAALTRTYLGGPLAAFAAEFGARCAINHLRSLDDDRLRDLGLEREDIERFVRFGRD
jgi:hypothetical protein